MRSVYSLPACERVLEWCGIVCSLVCSFFSNMKVGTKILVICLFLAIIPTLLLGLVSYTSSSSVISEQTQALLETQTGDMKGWTNDVYKLTRNKVNSDLNVAKQNFYAKGTPEVINDKMTLIDSRGNRYVVNDNFETVDQVQAMVGGAATVFQVYNNSYAVRISTNVLDTNGKRAVGTRLTDDVYKVTVNDGVTYYGRRDLFGKNYVTAYEPIKIPAERSLAFFSWGLKKDKPSMWSRRVYVKLLWVKTGTCT